MNDEYGESYYGSKCFSSEVLYWIGYLYRYSSYTYELSSKQIYKIVKSNELNQMYYVYHTFDPAQAIERILEEKGISFDITNQNRRLFKMLRDLGYRKLISLAPMTTNYAHMLFSNFENDVSLFENKEDFKEYIYNKDMIDKYVEEKRKKGYILLAIIYKKEIIGEIRFKKIDSDTYEIGIVLQNDRYKNRGIGSIAIEKAIEYAKNNLRVKTIVASILLNNSRSQHVFKKNGFVYKNDDEKFIYFYKKI